MVLRRLRLFFLAVTNDGLQSYLQSYSNINQSIILPCNEVQVTRKRTSLGRSWATNSLQVAREKGLLKDRMPWLGVVGALVYVSI